jgi:hypothetical protein
VGTDAFFKERLTPLLLKFRYSKEELLESFSIFFCIRMIFERSLHEIAVLQWELSNEF